MAKTREFQLFSDSTMSNPNGDVINENRPRQDDTTGKLEMSDVRIKRYVRDEYDNRGCKVFVRTIEDKKGKVLDCKGVAKKVIEDEKIKEEQLEGTLKKEYKDVKLFGAVVTGPKFNIAGPLQIMWSRSVHEAEVKFAQGTSAFSSRDEAKQGTLWSKYFTPYALFKTYMVYNDMAAKRQGIEVTEDDIEEFKDVLINGIKNYRSTSKNQMPRLLVEVIYKENHMDGEFDYVDAKYEKSDIELREIGDFTFDLGRLAEYCEKKKDVIEQVNIYRHPKVNVINGESSIFEIQEM